MDILSYFPFQTVLHNWAVSGMVHIKGHLLLIKLANGLVGTGFASQYRLQQVFKRPSG